MHLKDDAIYHQAELAPDLEWMLQSSHIEETAVAEALVREYYPFCLALAHCLCGSEEYARPLTYAALGRALAHRHEYWVEGGLPAWLAQQTYRMARESWWLFDWSMLSNLPLVFAEAGLSPLQIAQVLKQAQPKVERQLEKLRLRENPALRRRLEQAAELRSRPAPDGNTAQVVAGVVHEESGTIGQALRRRLFRLELLLGLAAALLVGGFSLWRVTTDPPAPTPTKRVVYVTATVDASIPTVPAPTPTPYFLPVEANLPRNFSLDLSNIPLQGEISSTLRLASIPLQAAVSSTLQLDAAQSGPFSLAWALDYWGAPGQTLIGLMELPVSGEVVLRPDELVAEMAKFSSYRTPWRYGGNLTLLERLITSGVPVIILHSDWSDPTMGWQPRYTAILGYDRLPFESLEGISPDQSSTVERVFLTAELDAQGAFLGSGSWTYTKLEKSWLEVGAPYMLVYPTGMSLTQKNNLLKMTGSDNDLSVNRSEALDMASLRLSLASEPLEDFFGLLNVARLTDSYNSPQLTARAIDAYLALPVEQRPWRAWGLYADVFPALMENGYWYKIIELADEVLAHPGSEGLEELYYWRGRAYWWSGRNTEALADIQQVLRIRPDHPDAQELLDRLTSP